MKSNSFMIGYLLFYYVILWLFALVLDETVTNSWAILGDYNAKMKIVLLVAPIVGALFSTLAASISVMSYTSMGSDRLGSSKFFMIGWFWFILSNMVILSTAMQLFIEEKIGREWIQYLDQIRFNTCLFLIAPSFGFAGGIAAVVLVRGLIQAQRE